MAEAEAPTQLVVHKGFMTKCGRVRKSWKQRMFQLQADGILKYYKVTDQVKKVGELDLNTCTVVHPGGRCGIKWHPGAHPNHCFGIMTHTRRLYLYADTTEDLGGWLAAIKSAVPKGVPVTTPEEILSSWGSDAVSQFSAPNGTSHVDRVTVFQNTSNSRTGKVIALPGTMAELLKAAGEAYGITGKRIFTATGGEVADVTLVRDDDVLYVSAGEGFAFAEEPAMSSMSFGAINLALSADSSSSSSEDEGTDLGEYAAPSVADGPDYMEPGPGPEEEGYIQPAARDDVEYCDPQNPSYLTVDTASTPDPSYLSIADEDKGTAKGGDADYQDASYLAVDQTKAANPDADYADPGQLR